MRNSLFLLIAFAFGLVGCQNAFERDDAERLISESDQFSGLSTYVQMWPKATDDGITQGLWNYENGALVFTDLAQKEISAIESGKLYTRDRVSIDLRVTGIRDVSTDPDVKAVELSWTYSGLSPLVRRFALAGGTGMATVAEYDDGWRVQNLQFDFSPEPYPLSETDVAGIEKDRTAVIVQIDKEKEKIRESFTYKDGDFFQQYLDASGDWGYEITSKDVRFIEKINGKFEAAQIVWFGKISMRSAYEEGVDIQPMTTCRYANIFRRAPSSIKSADLIKLIEGKRFEWIKRYANLDQKLLNDTYCQEHSTGGFPVNNNR